MSARSGLVGQKSSWPHLGPFQSYFSMGQKNAKSLYFLPLSLGGPMGPIHPCPSCFNINSEGFLAEVFHSWVRWEGPGSGFENSSGGAGGGVQKSGFFQTPFFAGF